MTGVTGRMGYRQHLVRSLLAIRDQGGVLLDDGTAILPVPVLVGRSEERLRQIAERHGIRRWTTSLDDVLSDPGIDIYFDARVTKHVVQRSEEHTSELQSHLNLVCRLLLEKKKNNNNHMRQFSTRRRST